MNDQRFDRIVRELTVRAGSRRRLVKGLAAGALTAATGAVLRSGNAEAKSLHTCCCYDCSALGKGLVCRCQIESLCIGKTGCNPISSTTVTTCRACDLP